ncbi:MAG TPA: TIR domain-containing protein, partial [Steroidobacteraceae bacterium]|nr:TIR domain-containing protein [Steroidobacteraceae bacterium]
MSRIFLSHSSRDEREAIALKQWLADQGWDDVFLDLDPERGLVAGERWQEALRKAADRCEAVVFIVSPDWAKSKWCLAEFLLAKSLNKRIFGVMLKEVPIGELPTEMTSEWQLALLVGDGPLETIGFEYKGAEDRLEFLGSGLKRLKIGLQKAGFAADFFRWPPEDEPHRSPYRGLQPLEIRDAAVFFGRDTEILQGLDALRGMRGDPSRQLFVILGASGAGKSSFLRAGLLPRLDRDDRHFLALPVVRPQGAPISGEAGLARALHDARVRVGIAGATLGQIKKQLKEGPSSLPGLLDELRAAARSRLGSEPGEVSPVPTVIISVDQGEELFSTDAGDEARPFLDLLAAALRESGESSSAARHTARTIVVVTIRSDRYEPLQSAPELEGIRSQVFDELKPMPPTRFREVITGPAKRASIEGGKLEVRPELVERLVSECTAGGDTLPLLGLTLERLYCDYGSDGDLRLDEYEAMGGLANVVKTEAESVLSSDPMQRRQELERLHAAFIPWLVTINPQNDQPMRRVARRTDLPEASCRLVDALAEKRLLLTDQREGETVVEVAHEAIFRQWDVLAEWIREHRDDFRVEESVERAAREWKAREDAAGREAWLLRGERLSAAEELAGKPGFRERLEQCREFLTESRRFEQAERAEEERRRNAELEAARQLAEEQRGRAEEQAKHSHRLRWALVAMALLAIAAGIAAKRALDQTRLAEEQTRLARQQTLEANTRRLLAESSAMLAGVRTGGTERALLQILAVHQRAPGPASEAALLDGIVGTRRLEWIIDAQEGISSVDFSPDGKRIVSGGWDGTVRLWDVDSAAAIGTPFQGHSGSVESVAFSQDGRRIASGSADGTARLWDAESGAAISVPLEGHKGVVTSVAFSPDGERIVSGGRDGTVRLWDGENGALIGAPLEGHQSLVRSVAFSPDGKRIVSGGEDGTMRLWDAASGAAIGAPLEGHEHPVVGSVAFSPDGERIVSGGDDGTVRLWDAETGAAIGAPLEGHKGGIRSVAFSPDGARIVSGSWDGTVRLWNAASAASVGVVIGRHESIVRSVAFSSDGDRVVSGGQDATVRLWDAVTGAAIGAPLEGHEHPVVGSV